MNRLARTLAAASFASFLALPAHAGMTVAGKPKVSFFATGSPGFLDIEGESTALTAADDGARLSFVVPMKTVSTGIDMRDAHMNDEYVQVAQFPNATLSVAKADVKWPAAVGEAATGSVKGTFNVHGIDQPVDVTYTAKKSKAGYRVTAKFAFDCSLHGIAIPSYLGITVDPKMTAEVTLDLIDG